MFLFKTILYGMKLPLFVGLMLFNFKSVLTQLTQSTFVSTITSHLLCIISLALPCSLPVPQSCHLIPIFLLLHLICESSCQFIFPPITQVLCLSCSVYFVSVPYFLLTSVALFLIVFWGGGVYSIYVYLSTIPEKTFNKLTLNSEGIYTCSQVSKKKTDIFMSFCLSSTQKLHFRSLKMINSENSKVQIWETLLS